MVPIGKTVHHSDSTGKLVECSEQAKKSGSQAIHQNLPAGKFFLSVTLKITPDMSIKSPWDPDY